MLLAFDIGNTNISFCKIKKNKAFSENIKKISYRKYKKREFKIILGKQIEDLIAGDEKIEGIIYSSVNKKIDSVIEGLAGNYREAKLLSVTSRLKMPVQILYDDPFTLGADRICDAVAASSLFPKKNCIIIDIGTAITFCVLLKGEFFKGGLIIPGIDMALDALFEKTDLLKRVDFNKPDKFIATNSADAIRSGIYYGWSSMLKSIVQKIEADEQEEFYKIITGGFAEKLLRELPTDYFFDKYLIMKGLKILFDLNC